MDGQRFDELARWLGGGTSRRGVLKGIAAGLGASVFGFAVRHTPNASAEVGVPCATDDDCDAGEFCLDPTEQQSGTCQPTCLAAGQPCTTTDECCDLDVCTGGVCAAPTGCAGAGQACGDLPCCGELTCFQGTCGMVSCGGEGDPCSEIACCTGSGLICVEGYCAYPACIPDGHECDFVTVAFAGDGSNCCGYSYCLEGICVPNCIGQGGDCWYSEDCCDGLSCTDAYTCEYIPVCGDANASCEDDYDCCAGLVCSDKGDCVAGACGVPGAPCEMVEDHGCCPGLTCFEAQCDNPSGLCMDKGEYCDGKYFLCCEGLFCGDDSFCHKKHHGGGEPEPPAPKPQGPAVTTLPGTGSGNGPGDDGSGWLNAAALGGAAAVIGGALIRKKQGEPDTESEEA